MSLWVRWSHLVWAAIHWPAAPLCLESACSRDPEEALINVQPKSFLRPCHGATRPDWPLRHWFLEKNVGVGCSWSRFSPAAALVCVDKSVFHYRWTCRKIVWLIIYVSLVTRGPGTLNCHRMKDNLYPKWSAVQGGNYQSHRKQWSFPADVYTLKNISLMDMREALCESRNFSSSLGILKYRSRVINPACLPHVAKPKPGSELACPSEPGCDCRGKLQSLAADSAPSEWLTCWSALTHFSLLGYFFPHVFMPLWPENLPHRLLLRAFLPFHEGTQREPIAFIWPRCLSVKQ